MESKGRRKIASQKVGSSPLIDFLRQSLAHRGSTLTPYIHSLKDPYEGAASGCSDCPASIRIRTKSHLAAEGVPHQSHQTLPLMFRPGSFQYLLLATQRSFLLSPHQFTCMQRPSCDSNLANNEQIRNAESSQPSQTCCPWQLG